MKNIIYSLIVLCTLMLSSCLTSGLEELPLYEDAEITSVTAVKYRYISDEKSPSSGEFIVKEVDLSFEPSINEENGVVKIDVSLPTNFPQSEIDKVNNSNLLVVINISTAARIFPIEGAPKLGIPGNWEKPNRYKVLAANGTEKQWTIEVSKLNK